MERIACNAAERDASGLFLESTIARWLLAMALVHSPTRYWANAWASRYQYSWDELSPKRTPRSASSIAGFRPSPSSGSNRQALAMRLAVSELVAELNRVSMAVQRVA